MHPLPFCRLMHSVLHDVLYTICLCCLDDIIVYAETPQELIERLDVIFTRLHEHGVKAKAYNCVLFKSPIDFLGHTVSAEVSNLKLRNLLLLEIGQLPTVFVT